MPRDSSKRYCMACGERKRLTWPKDNPICCTMWCAATSFTSYGAVSDDWEASHCTNCGKSGDDHLHEGDALCDHEIVGIMIDKGGE